MKMKILAFTGMPFSGKTEAVKLAKNRGIPIIRMGDMIWREVKNQGLELSDKNVGIVASKMREKFGKNIWAKKTLEEIKIHNDLVNELNFEADNNKPLSVREVIWVFIAYGEKIRARSAS